MAKNLFETASPARIAGIAPKGRAKDILEILGLETYTMMDVVLKALTARKEGAKAIMTDAILDYMVAEGTRTGKRPKNPTGVEGDAEASMQYKLNPHALSDIKLELLAQHGIPVEVREDVAETFIFNPKLADRLRTDRKFAEKLSAALSRVDGIGDNPIMFQESTKKSVATEESIDAVFRLKLNDPETLRQLLLAVGTTAVRPKMRVETNIRSCLLAVVRMFRRS